MLSAKYIPEDDGSGGRGTSLDDMPGILGRHYCVRAQHGTTSSETPKGAGRLRNGKPENKAWQVPFRGEGAE